MPGGEEHRGNGQNLGHALLPERLKAIPKDRSREFQISVFDRHRGQARTEAVHHLGEFLHRQSIAASMAADQNAKTLVAGFCVRVGQEVVPLFQWFDPIGRIAVDSGRPLFINTQAADARRSGLVSPRPGELPSLIKNWSGPRPLRLCSGGTTSRSAVADNWTVDVQTHFKQLEWQPADQTVGIGAGCRMGEVLEALRPHGRTIVAGLSGLPGLGYLLTGGMGPLSRHVGLAVDQLLEIRGLWGDGTPFALTREADGGSPEWRGLCGAAPFLALVSEVRMATQPLQPLWLEQRSVSADDLPELMLQAEASDPSVSLQWHWENGDAVQLLRIASAAWVGAQRIEGLHQLPSLRGSAPMPPRCHAEVVGLLGPASAEAWGALIPELRLLLQKRPHPGCSLACQQLGAATQQVSVEASSFVHRDAEWKPWITAAWSPGDMSGQRRSLDWLEAVWQILQPVCPGVHLAQFHDHLPFHQEELEAAFGPWLPELRKLKQRLDPQGMLPSL